MKATRIQRIITTMQYLITYESGMCDDDIFDQVIELLSHEEIEYRAVQAPDEDKWVLDIGGYLLN